MSGASIKHACGVWVVLLVLSACGRLGFQEHALTPVGSDAGSLDAGAPDSGGADADPEDAGPGDAAQDAAATSCTTLGNFDYCTALPHLDHVPVIDGRLECGLTLRPFTPQGWVGSTFSIPADQGKARVAMAWHEDGIYIYLEIDDDSLSPPAASDDIWCGDAAEAYVDSDGVFSAVAMYDNPGASQFIATPPTGNPNDVPRSMRFRDGNTDSGRVWSTPNHATFMTDTGYGLEAFITAPDLDLESWKLQAGATVGVDVSANVSSTPATLKAGAVPDCGTRVGQYFLRSATLDCLGKACTPYRNTTAFCTPTLR